MEPTEAYQEGRRFFNRHRGAIRRIRWCDMPYVPRVSDNYQQHDDFHRGLNDAKEEYIQQTLGVARFLEALGQVCKEHNIRVSAGCGCCGGGGQVKDANGDTWEFMF